MSGYKVTVADVVRGAEVVLWGVGEAAGIINYMALANMDALTLERDLLDFRKSFRKMFILFYQLHPGSLST